MLGARWSYMELGWGGYWAWDPVENASLMPWLTGTAFLHSVMIQEKRGMLKVWNVSLVLATGVLAILGTFLVRSGILESIHAFGASTLGIPFLVLIVTMIGGSIALVSSRAESLRSEHRLDSLLSREAAFLLNNLVLVALCFVVFWGTFFPLISEALTGEEASVGPPWFNRYITPLALVLVLLSGIGPLIAWRRATAANLRRNFALPVGAGVLALAVLVAAGVTGSVPALLMFAFAAFVLGAVGQELWRGVRARRAMSRDSVPRALVALVRRNRRRYGGYTVHVGHRGDVRRGRGVVGVPGPAARRAAARPDGADRRLRGHLRAADLPARRGGQRPARADRPRRAAAGAQGRRRRRARSTRTSPTSPARTRASGPVSRFFEGEATSEVALQAGLRRDFWAAVGPDIGRLRPIVERGDKVLAGLSDAQLDQLLGEVLGGLANRYAREPAARDVPLHRLAARELDLARRADRARRRRDRAVARGRRRAPAGDRGRPRPRRARARTRLRTPSGDPARARPGGGRRARDQRAAARVAARRRATSPAAAERADLEAARDAKYAEIRDAEMDYRTGKLSEADWRALDRQLRHEAVELLHRLDAAEDDPDPLP